MTHIASNVPTGIILNIFNKIGNDLKPRTYNSCFILYTCLIMGFIPSVDIKTLYKYRIEYMRTYNSYIYEYGTKNSEIKNWVYFLVPKKVLPRQ